MRKVKLTYFKPTTGKYYTEAIYLTAKRTHFELAEEVDRMRANNRLPGLVEGHSRFIVLIDCSRLPEPGPPVLLL
jgi:hypothetical protein